MVRRLIATAAVAITVIGGCSTSSPTPGPSHAAPQSPAASPGAGGIPDDLFTFTGPPDTLNLSITTEEASAVVGSIGPDGGQLTATAADGTTYTLDIPSGAVLFAEDISMTPIVEVEGLPGDTTPAHTVGVTLEPDGLQLYSPATLRITPPSALPEVGVSTISFLGDGEDAGLAFFDQGASEIAVPVEHFSGYAAFWPVDADWWSQYDKLRRMVDADELRDTLVTLLRNEQQRQLMIRGEAEVTGLPLDELMVELRSLWEQKVLGPLRRNAANGCREASDAVAAYGEWEKQLQLAGISLKGLTPEEYQQATDEQRALDALTRLGDPPDELLTLKRDLCFEEQFQRCRQTGDFEFLVSYFLAHFRQIELLGTEVSQDDIGLAQLYLERCGLWDLTIESIEDFGAGGSSALVHQIRTYPIRWHPNYATPGVPDSGTGPVYGLVGTHAIGDGATEIVGVEVTHPRCRGTNTYHGTAPPDTAEIERLIFDQRPNVVTTIRPRWLLKDYHLEQSDEPVPRKVELGLSFGTQSWTTAQVCPDLVHSWTWTQDNPGFYLPRVLYVHDALNKHEWRFDSGPFSAKMTITDSFIDTDPLPPVSVDVEVIITLEHTPAP